VRADAPWNDPRRDIARKRGRDDDLFLVAVADGTVVGTVMGGYDGHRGWVNYLAVDPSWQRRGLGERLVREVERRLLGLGCPKVNLQVRDGNEAALAFYGSIGYAIDPVTSFGKRLVDDEAPGESPAGRA
jgi:ribosomal protein S18 acetylase RimI-like enzyme